MPKEQETNGKQEDNVRFPTFEEFMYSDGQYELDPRKAYRQMLTDHAKRWWLDPEIRKEAAWMFITDVWTEYIEESEHQDGSECWLRMAPEEIVYDFTLFCQHYVQ